MIRFKSAPGNSYYDRTGYGVDFWGRVQGATVTDGRPRRSELVTDVKGQALSRREIRNVGGVETVEGLRYIYFLPRVTRTLFA